VGKKVRKILFTARGLALDIIADDAGTAPQELVADTLS